MKSVIIFPFYSIQRSTRLNTPALPFVARDRSTREGRTVKDRRMTAIKDSGRSRCQLRSPLIHRRIEFAADHTPRYDAATADAAVAVVSA